MTNCYHVLGVSENLLAGHLAELVHLQSAWLLHYVVVSVVGPENQMVIWGFQHFWRSLMCFLVISVMSPFHSQADVDQKLLFSMACSALRGSLSMTVNAAVTTNVFIIKWLDSSGAALTVTELLSLTATYFSLPLPLQWWQRSPPWIKPEPLHTQQTFYQGPGKSEGMIIESVKLCEGGHGEGLTFPDPAQSLQGLRPIPTQVWQPCMWHIPQQQNRKANTTTLTSKTSSLTLTDEVYGTLMTFLLSTKKLGGVAGTSHGPGGGWT